MPERFRPVQEAGLRLFDVAVDQTMGALRRLRHPTSITRMSLTLVPVGPVIPVDPADNGRAGSVQMLVACLGQSCLLCLTATIST